MFLLNLLVFLEYFIFENSKIEEDIFAQMYFYVIKRLFQQNSQLLISHQDILKITRNMSDFRTAKEVENGWYIETNTDSHSKFIILKKLLVLFELEDELLLVEELLDDELPPLLANHEFSFTPFTLKLSLC